MNLESAVKNIDEIVYLRINEIGENFTIVSKNEIKRNSISYINYNYEKNEVNEIKNKLINSKNFIFFNEKNTSNKIYIFHKFLDIDIDKILRTYEKAKNNFNLNLKLGKKDIAIFTNFNELRHNIKIIKLREYNESI